MGQQIQRLTALAVTRASKPGLYADGAGLYLRVSRNGSKSWDDYWMGVFPISSKRLTY